jgi:hypothetical protein
MNLSIKKKLALPGILPKVIFVTYPLAFALYPTFSLYQQNIEELTPDMLVFPALLFGIISLLLYLAIYVFLKDIHKTGIVVFLSFFMVFSYAPISLFIKGFFKIQSPIYHNPFFYLSWIFFFTFLMHSATFTNADLSKITKSLALVSYILLLTPLLLVANYISDVNKTHKVLGAKQQETLKIPTDVKRPDIYYLIFDRYANQNTLQNYFNFDNQEFLNNLENKGFYIASDSAANHLKTAHSLASSLNMNYIQNLVDKNSMEKNLWKPIYSLIKNNDVQNLLDNNGYTTINIGSWWSTTYENQHSDINLKASDVTQFSQILIDNSLLLSVGATSGYYNSRVRHGKFALYEFDAIKSSVNVKAPKFVFAHVLLPHTPFIFNSDGSLLSESQLSSRTFNENYLNQLQYTNKRIVEIVDYILDNSDNPPIIIIQSDEGPHPVRYSKNEEEFDWSSATKEELEKKLYILNTFYLPGFDHSKLYQQLSPVNTFRIIFNHYFGANLELLPDKTYIHANDNHPYDFIDVGDIFQQ